MVGDTNGEAVRTGIGVGTCVVGMAVGKEVGVLVVGLDVVGMLVVGALVGLIEGDVVNVAVGDPVGGLVGVKVATGDDKGLAVRFGIVGG